MSKHMRTHEKQGVAVRLRRLPVGAVLTMALAGASVSPVKADEIYFKSGYSETAVVIREDKASVRFRTEMGLFTISKEKIDFVDEAAEEENRTLLKTWRDKERRLEEQLEAKREAQRKFEAEQFAKGLIKFEGEWMTPQQRQEALNLRRRARDHRLKFEQEQRERGLVKFQHIWVTPKTEEELLEMEAEIKKLSEELENQNKMVESLRSAMLNINSIEEAEQFSERIEEATESITLNTRKLDRLFKRADEIESLSVQYEAPEEFVGVFPSEEEFE